MTSLAAPATADESIRVYAHLLWEQEGRPDGRALSHWLEAEHQIHPHANVSLQSLAKTLRAAWQADPLSHSKGDHCKIRISTDCLLGRAG